MNDYWNQKAVSKMLAHERAARLASANEREYRRDAARYSPVEMLRGQMWEAVN